MNQKIDLSGDEGVFKTLLQKGMVGFRAKEGDEVELHYIGRTETGVQFDSSREKGRPLKVIIGKTGVIKGWEICLPTMYQGEKCMLSCRQDYGYGMEDYGAIPGGSTLVFEMELVSVKELISSASVATRPVTNYFPIFFKDYAVQYGDSYFTMTVRSASIIENSGEICCSSTGKYVAYNIDVIRGKRLWTVQKRYREIRLLFEKAKYTHLPFPPKTYLPDYSPSFIQDRIGKLNSFLDSYLQALTVEEKMQGNALVSAFFGLN